MSVLLNIRKKIFKKWKGVETWVICWVNILGLRKYIDFKFYVYIYIYIYSDNLKMVHSY